MDFSHVNVRGNTIYSRSKPPYIQQKLLYKFIFQQGIRIGKTFLHRLAEKLKR